MEIPIKPLKVERTNGFFSNLGDSSSLLQLPRFIKSTGLTSPADVELFAAYTIESLGVGSFLREKIEALKRFFSDTRVIATHKSRIEIAVTELHCPRATGAKAKLSVVRETEETEDFSVEILGIGGGDEYTTTFSVGDELETSDGACIAAIYSVLAVFESCEIDTPDGQVRRFVRLKNLEPDNESIRGVKLVGAADACQTANFGDLTNVTQKRFEFRDYGSATFGRDLSLERGSKWKGQAKIKLDDLGIDIGASYEGSRTHKTELKYTLVGGFDYLAIKPQNQLSWIWRITS